MKVHAIPSILAVFSAFACTSGQSSSSTTTTVKTFKLYHSLGQTKPFVPRGNIHFNIDENGELLSTIENDESCLGPNALEDMDALVSESGFYRIKVVDEEEGGSGSSVMASVPGCEVRRANFREEIELSMSQTGSLLSISYTPIVSPLAAECHELQPLSTASREYKFNSLLSYTTSTPGMVLPKVLPKMRPPHGLNAIKLNKKSAGGNTGTTTAGTGSGTNDDNDNNNEQNTGSHRFHAEEDDEKKNQEQNQSFLRKYWYIILPVSIMTFLGPEPDEESTKATQRGQQQQQAQGQQRQQGGLQGGGNNTTRQRRGKRG